MSFGQPHNEDNEQIFDNNTSPTNDTNFGYFDQQNEQHNFSLKRSVTIIFWGIGIFLVGFLIIFGETCYSEIMMSNMQRDMREYTSNVSQMMQSIKSESSGQNYFFDVEGKQTTVSYQ